MEVANKVFKWVPKKLESIQQINQAAANANIRGKGQFLNPFECNQVEFGWILSLYPTIIYDNSQPVHLYIWKKGRKLSLVYYLHDDGMIEEFLDKVDVWDSEKSSGPTFRDEAIWLQSAKGGLIDTLKLFGQK